MNKQILVISTIVVLLTVCLCGCISRGIWAKKLDYIPKDFIDMTDQQLEDFPYLKEAILTGEYVETSPEEFNKLHEFLNDYDDCIIKYQENYYEILLSTT